MKLKRRSILKGLAAMPFAGGLGRGAEASYNASIRVPAEEDEHELTFMQWPNNRQVYSDRWFLKQVQQTIADIANAAGAFEKVVLLADKKHHAAIRKLVSENVELWDIPTDDLWCRDAGPLVAFDQNGKRVVSHIQFNGWGNKQTHENDGRIAGRLASALGFSLVESGLSGEPGGAEQDGHGLLMAHESSWVISNRNTGMNRPEVERRLMAAYGAEKMIWAPGLKGLDITDYHIDSLARFTAPGRVLLNLPKNPDENEPFHNAALETHDILIASGLEVDVILEPEKRRVKSKDFVASYVNFYVCNGAVIGSRFGDEETDQVARDALKRHYPDREIVMLNADVLGKLGGGIHCATQQLPAA